MVADRNGGLHGGGGFECPPGTTGCGIQRVNGSVLAPNKQPACIGCRLAIGGGGVGKAERPLQFQGLDLIRAEARRLLRLKACIVWVHAPTAPDWRISRGVEIARTEARHLRDRRQVGHPEVIGDGVALRLRHHLSFPLHLAGFQGAQNGGPGHLFQAFRKRSFRAAIGTMTGFTLLHEQRFTVRCRCLLARASRSEKRCEHEQQTTLRKTNHSGSPKIRSCERTVMGCASRSTEKKRWVKIRQRVASWSWRKTETHSAVFIR